MTRRQTADGNEKPPIAEGGEFNHFALRGDCLDTTETVLRSP
jgi:hypothetical protein